MKRDIEWLPIFIVGGTLLVSCLAGARTISQDKRIDAIERKAKLSPTPCPCQLEQEAEAEPELDLPRFKPGVVR